MFMQVLIIAKSSFSIVLSSSIVLPRGAEPASASISTLLPENLASISGVAPKNEDLPW